MSRKQAAGRMEDDDLIRIPPYHYIHVMDLNSNVTRVIIGPMKYVRAENEVVVKQSEAMTTVPPDCYCVVRNPAMRNENGQTIKAERELVKLHHGDTEVRLTQEPFPLYPGEEIITPITHLSMVPPHHAVRLEAISDFTDVEGNERRAGDQWLFRGPGLYIPRKEETVINQVESIVIESHQAVRVKATHDFVDRNEVKRVMGQEWLVRETGSYMPDAYEAIVEMVDGIQLSENSALYLRATQDGTDVYGKQRRTGEEWLVKHSDTNMHIKDVLEEIVKVVNVITLSVTQYVVILNPFDEESSTSLLGKKKLLRGPCSFFLKPREALLNSKVFDVWFAKENEALLLKANETHVEKSGAKRTAGDMWLLQSKEPIEYVPPVEVTIVEKREALPLEQHEGVYVRNIRTGNIRLVSGDVYMLTAEEELWEKEIPTLGAMNTYEIKQLRLHPKPQPYLKETQYWALCYKLPDKHICKLFDFKRNKYRNKHGPCIFLLNPNEEITELMKYRSDMVFGISKAFKHF